FTKMHGCGNDYIYVNGFEEKVSDKSKAAITLSDRHFGIGSDGIIFINPSDKADFEMEMYNADGSRAEMCGNGIRCVAKYVYDKGLTDKTRIRVETLAGIKELDLKVESGKVNGVTVNMGVPELSGAKIPSTFEGDKVINEALTVGDKEYRVTLVNMGNPHAIVYMEDIDSLEIEKLGPLFENHKVFPKRINTEFVEVIDKTKVKMRVWERGAGETWACGTGASAVLVASVLNNKTERSAVVSLRGGDLSITWDKDSGEVFMTGPAEIVFDGETTENF
nr:diaminopimelate epimerase [Lachnospiraceae bacterium]